MVIPNAPKLALGGMAMDIYRKLSMNITEVEISPLGVKRVYSLILLLDALLYSYRESMTLTMRNKKTKKIETLKYYSAKELLLEEESELSFKNPSHFHKWNLWFSEYLQLLSSCFNVIGLAPATFKVFEDKKNPIKIIENPEWKEYLENEGEPDEEGEFVASENPSE